MNERFSPDQYLELLDFLEMLSEGGKNKFPDWDEMSSEELLRIDELWHFRRVTILFSRGELFPGNIPQTEYYLNARTFAVLMQDHAAFTQDTHWGLRDLGDGRIQVGVDRLVKYGVYVNPSFLRKLKSE